MEASEVVALLMPMVRSMLSARELASLRLELVAIDDPQGDALQTGDLVEQNSAAVRWWIRNERGCSGGLHLDEGPTAFVRSVQSDLQDFIADSRFGWGQLRGPRDLP